MKVCSTFFSQTRTKIRAHLRRRVIVTMSDGASAEDLAAVRALAVSLGGELAARRRLSSHTGGATRTLLRVFVADGLDEPACAVLLADARVADVRPDWVALESAWVDYSWALDRVDAPLDSRTYDVGDWDGAGVGVFLLDGGIDFGHQEFDGARQTGTPYSVDNSDDGLEHGTFCASAAAGLTTGLAPGAHVYSLRVKDSDDGTSVSDFLGGLDVVADYAHEGGKAVVSIALSALCPTNPCSNK